MHFCAQELHVFAYTRLYELTDRHCAGWHILWLYTCNLPSWTQAGLFMNPYVLVTTWLCGYMGTAPVPVSLSLICTQRLLIPGHRNTFSWCCTALICCVNEAWNTQRCVLAHMTLPLGVGNMHRWKSNSRLVYSFAYLFDSIYKKEQFSNFHINFFFLLWTPYIFRFSRNLAGIFVSFAVFYVC